MLAAPLGQPVKWATGQSVGSYPPGYDADHIDTTRALAQHTHSVIGSSSAHTNVSYAASASGGASAHTIEVWTNYQRHVQLMDAAAVYASGQRYAADGLVYTKTKVSYVDRINYDRTRGDILIGRSTGAEILEKFLPYLDFELHKTTNGDGQRLFIYEATSFDTESFTMSLRRVETVRSDTASLIVDEQGRIHTFTFDLDAWGDDGNPLTVKTSIALDGFGQTTVQQPEWVQTEF